MTGDQETLKALGRRVRKARRDADLTLNEVAARAGVSRVCVAMWQGGHRDPGVGGLLALAGALGVTAGRLLGEDEPAVAP